MALAGTDEEGSLSTLQELKVCGATKESYIRDL
jgi:hypothetical protein